MVTVIVILTVFFAILLMVVGVPLLLLWIVRNSIQAAKYRALVHASSQVRTGYTIVYKSGRKTEKMDLDGATEGEAMMDLVKRKVSYDKIISLTKK